MAAFSVSLDLLQGSEQPHIKPEEITSKVVGQACRVEGTCRRKKPISDASD